MKKYRFIPLLVILLLVVFTGCSKEEGSDGKNYLVNISYEEFVKKRENKESFFFAVIQDGCPYCEAYTPKLKEVLKEYKIVGYSLNLSDLTDEERQEFQLKFKVSGTPNTIFLTEGEEVSKMQRISGNAAKTKIVSKLKSNGYIKE